MLPAQSWEFLKAKRHLLTMSSAGEPPVIGAGQTFCTRLRGWTFAAMMLLSALFGSVYIITPIIPLLFWNPRLWRKCMDRLVGVWVIMPGALMTFLFGAKVSIVGDRIEHGEPAVIIMNHRTRLDWLYFWNALFKVDPWLCTSEKISLKGVLKYVPGAGWAMGCNSFIFLDRSFETDRTKLDSMLDYYANCGYNYQLLLFPEGTDKCPKATERSRQFAEKKGLEHYKYVLHPRTTGFVHIIQNMRKANNIRYLYDVTIGFDDCIVQSEVDLVLHGVCSTDVKYQVIKIDIDEVPQDDLELAKWLVRLWKGKEDKLAEFYSKTGPDRKFDNTPGGTQFEMDERTLYAQMFICAFWIVVSLLWMYAFFEVNLMFIFFLISCSIFFFIQYFYGGIEWLAITKFNESRAVRTEPVPLVQQTNGKMMPPPASDSE